MDNLNFNKKGQVFWFYFVFIVVFMIATVWGFYTLQGLQYGTTASSLVSPRSVFESRDSLEIFEYFEEKYLEESLEESNGEFGSSQFLESFRNSFLDKVSQDPFMKNFLVLGVEIGGRPVEDIALGDFSSFIENVVYPKDFFYFESGKIFVKRDNISKRKFLVSNEPSKRNFSVDFIYSFEAIYEIEQNNSGKYYLKKIGANI